MTAGATLRARFLAGDPRALARALTWAAAGDARVERLRATLPGRAPGSVVVGLTGPPGAGKSTLADALTAAWRAAGRRVAVLAVDPSAPLSGGALLGDRVRLQRGAADPAVFVRSFGSRARGGGLAPGLAAAVGLVLAFGFDRVLLETVGAGQAEVDVVTLADTLVVLQAPGLGDDVQAAKAGLLDVADVLAVGKADLPGADRLLRELHEALAVRAAAGTAAGAPPAVVPVAAGAPPAARPSELAVDGGVGALVDAVEAHAARGAHDVRAAARLRLQVGAGARERLAWALAALPAARWQALARGEASAAELASEVLGAAAEAARAAAVAAAGQAEAIGPADPAADW